MKKDIYSIAVIGFSETEQTVLTSMFGLSSRREPKFVRYEESGKKPDIYLVDASDQSAVQQLAMNNSDNAVPTVLVGDSNCGTNWPVLQRPIRWMKLFQAFDAAVVPGAAPIQSAVPPAPATPTATAAVQPAAGSSAEWVLVVDDNQTVREFMKSKLAPFNFNVDFAESGEQAIGYTGQKHYTCIFLDVVMPGIDGYQVCKVIKASKTAQKTAVVMLTSKDSPFDKIRGSMSGCDAYLTKPVDEERLLETISKFLHTH